MDQETLFTGSKWDILKLLETKAMSPLELASKSGTSMANISQQLRFLEMAGIVTSKRIPNRDKGQPRVIYSLSGNKSFLISVSPGFVEKSLKELNYRKKAILKIWFYDEIEHQHCLEKAFTGLDNYLSEIEAVAVERNGSSVTSKSPITLTVVTNDGFTKRRMPDMSVTNPNGLKTTVRYKMIRRTEVKMNDSYYSIYDPNSIFGENRKKNDTSELGGKIK